jgi:hypothetical protein
MKQNIHMMQLTTLDMTWVAPSECGTQRGSDNSLQAPCLNPGPRRWLTRCVCLTHSGRWPDPLPSSCSLGWCRPCSIAGHWESQSHVERPVDECSAPVSHPSGAQSPSWGYPSSPHRPSIDPSSFRGGGGVWSSATDTCCCGPMM